jgi:signal recognition particle GTPase
MWLTIGVWACALAATACTGVVVAFMIESRRAEAAMMAALDGHGKTTMLAALDGHGKTTMMAVEVLTMDIDRLKQRVLDLETDAL